jgi:hypothetical protein
MSRGELAMLAIGALFFAVGVLSGRSGNGRVIQQIGRFGHEHEH